MSGIVLDLVRLATGDVKTMTEKVEAKSKFIPNQSTIFIHIILQLFVVTFEL